MKDIGIEAKNISEWLCFVRRYSSMDISNLFVMNVTYIFVTFCHQKLKKMLCIVKIKITRICNVCFTFDFQTGEEMKSMANVSKSLQLK